MPEPYSTQFFLALAPGGDGVVYTSPVGFVSVVRDLEVWQPVDAGSGIYVGVEHTSGTAQVVLVYEPGPVTPKTIHWEGNVVLNEGDKVFVAGGSPELAATASGFLLTKRP